MTILAAAVTLTFHAPSHHAGADSCNSIAAWPDSLTDGASWMIVGLRPNAVWDLLADQWKGAHTKADSTRIFQFYWPVARNVKTLDTLAHGNLTIAQNGKLVTASVPKGWTNYWELTMSKRGHPSCRSNIVGGQ